MKRQYVVAITRPASGARIFAKLLRKVGATPYLAPTIETRALTLNRSLTQAIRMSSTRNTDYWIFMSVTSIETLLSMARKIAVLKALHRNLTHAKIIAVGPSTAHALRSKGISPATVPQQYSTKGLVSFFRQHRISGKEIAICRSKNADAMLARSLRKLGNRVRELRVYESALPANPNPVKRLIREINRGRIGMLTFTSPQSVRNFFRIARDVSPGNLARNLSSHRVKIAAIGVTTARCLKSFGIKHVSVPNAYTIRTFADHIGRMIGSR